MSHLSVTGPGLVAENGGLFVRTVAGRHPKRIIPSHELIVVRSGVLAVREGNQAWKILPGESLILEPGFIHEGFEDYPPGLSFYWIHFRLIAKLARQKNALIPKRSRLERPERMMELFHRFLDDQERGDQLPEESAAIVLCMLMETKRQMSGPVPDSSNLVGRAEAWIKTSFARGISTHDVARQLRVNPDYLGRLFRRHRGDTVIDAIHREQMREARILLRESSANIGEIGRLAGFRDPSYFRRLFQRIHGNSPRGYRRLYARLHVNLR